MNEFQASQLKPGDTIVHAGVSYSFLRLDEDGDILAENPTGAPTPVALYRSRCALPAQRVEVQSEIKD
jgi:hypothetical protein